MTHMLDSLASLVATRRRRIVVSIGGWGILLVLIALGAQAAPSAIQLMVTTAFVLLTGVLALQIFSGNSGILSFGHVGFVGIAAYTTGILAMPPVIKATSLPALPKVLQDLTLPLPLAMLAGIVVASFVGLLFGLVIVRLGDAASIATVAVLIIIHSTLIGADSFTRGSQTFYGVPRYTTIFLALGIAILALIAARVFRDSRLGLQLRASRDDELAASSSGVRTHWSRLIAWVLSAAVAGAMGSVYAGLLGAFSPRDFFFTLTLTLLTMLIVGGSGSVAGAVVGTIVVTIVVETLRRVGDANELFGLTSAGLAIIILLTLYLRPQGIMGFREPEEILAYRLAPPSPQDDTTTRFTDLTPDDAPHVLTAHDVTKRFSGLVALDKVSISVDRGRVTGLIGPNGSGKSTLVNCITGVNPADQGTISLDGRDIDGLTTWRRARAGLGRTFQNIRLFTELTVIDNVVVACICAGDSVHAADNRARLLLRSLGVLEHGNRLAGELSYGNQRRVEIARAMALHPQVLLLDEPAAGMNPAESAALLAQLNELISNTGIGVLLIDHDVALIRTACHTLTVLDHGAVIAQGEPAEVLSRPEVRDAYLGVAGPDPQSTAPPQEKESHV